MELLAKHYQSPRWSWEILDCSMPMTFDTYSNCAFQCEYCFSFFQRAIGAGADDYLHHRVEAVNVQKVKDLFLGRIPSSQFNWYIKSRRVMQWGGLSDGFDYYERKFRKSLELLRFFNEIDYPISISTKGVWFLDDPEYVEAFTNAKNVHMKSSIITLDAEKAHAVERGVATPEQRFQALYKLNQLGVGATTVRFRPFVLGISADYPYTDISQRQIEEYVHRTKEAGCYSLTTEFLCLESRSSKKALPRFKHIGEICGIPDLMGFYKHFSQSRGGLLRLNYDIKRPYMEAMREACDKYDVKFFVSDAHHKELSYHAGCCGLPENGPLSRTNLGQYAQAILIAKRNGKVHWSDIEKDADGLENIRFYAAEGFNQGGTDERVKRMYQNMKDYMRDVWNNPKSGMSPARYFGGALVPADPDDNGDIVYLYNAPYILKATDRVSSVGQLQARLEDFGYDLQRDGSDWGHVAYDAAVNFSAVAAPGKHPVLEALGKNRINFTLYVPAGSSVGWNDFYPNYDIVELPRELESAEFADALIIKDYELKGIEWLWLLQPDLDLGGKTPRAALSAAEMEFAEAKQPGQQYPGAALVRCADVTPEQMATF